MFFCHPQDGLYVVICQAIAYQLSLAAVFHQLGLLQQPELVGNRRLAGPYPVRQLLHKHLAVKQAAQDFDPGGIPEYLEQLRHINQQVLTAQEWFHTITSPYFLIFTYEYVFICILQRRPVFVKGAQKKICRKVERSGEFPINLGGIPLAALFCSRSVYSVASNPSGRGRPKMKF